MERKHNVTNGGGHRPEALQVLSPEQASQVPLDALIAREAFEAELRERRGKGDLQPSSQRAEISSVDRSQRRLSGEAESRQQLANVYRDPERHTVTLLLDEATANTVIYAVRALAADSEAHAREVRIIARTLPPDSYGAVNRRRIATRHERLAARLRMLESNYRTVVG